MSSSLVSTFPLFLHLLLPLAVLSFPLSPGGGYGLPAPSPNYAAYSQYVGATASPANTYGGGGVLPSSSYGLPSSSYGLPSPYSPYSTGFGGGGYPASPYQPYSNYPSPGGLYGGSGAGLLGPGFGQLPASPFGLPPLGAAGSGPLLTGGPIGAGPFVGGGAPFVGGGAPFVGGGGPFAGGPPLGAAPTSLNGPAGAPGAVPFGSQNAGMGLGPFGGFGNGLNDNGALGASVPNGIGGNGVGLPPAASMAAPFLNSFARKEAKNDGATASTGSSSAASKH